MRPGTRPTRPACAWQRTIRARAGIRAGTTRDTAAAAIDRIASCTLRPEAAFACHAHQLGQPAHLGAGGRGAKWRDPVVAPPLVILARASLEHFGDQALLHHPGDRAVEG